MARRLLATTAACLVVVLVVAAAARVGTLTAPEHANTAVLAAYFAGPQTAGGATDATGSTGSTVATGATGSTGASGGSGSTGPTGSTGTTGSGSNGMDWFDANCQLDTADATALRVQKDVVFQISAIESTLGSQGGIDMLAQCDAQGEFYIWVAPGPLDLAAATSAIDAIFVSALGQTEAAWFESHLTVQSAPYSESELDQTAQPIEALVTDEPTPAAWHVGVAVTEPYPVVEITLWNDRTAADVSAAQALVSQYGGMVTLILSDSPPPSPVDASALIGLAVVPSAPSAPTQHPSGRAPAAVAPSLRIVHYNRRRLRAEITIAPGSLPLHNLVVSIRSRSNVLLAHRKLRQLDTVTHLTLRLSAAPRHVTVTLHAGTTNGKAVLLHSKI